MKQVLRIIFTSDVHGYFFPTDYNDRNEKPMGLFHIASRFNKDENTLIIDGGDTLPKINKFCNTSNNSNFKPIFHSEYFIRKQNFILRIKTILTYTIRIQTV